MRVIAAGIGLLFSSLLFMASSMGVVEILAAWRKGTLPSYYQNHWEVFWSVVILNAAAFVVLALLGRSLLHRTGDPAAAVEEVRVEVEAPAVSLTPSSNRFSVLRLVGFSCFLLSYLIGYFIPSVL